MSPRRAVYLTSFLACVAVVAVAALTALSARERAESDARRHAERLAATAATAAQAAGEAPRLVDAALNEHLAAQAALLAVAVDLAAAGKLADRDVLKRLESAVGAGAAQVLGATGPDGAFRLRADRGDPAATFVDLQGAAAQAAAQPGAPVIWGAARSPDDARVVKAAALATTDGRGAATGAVVVAADVARVRELARLLGVDGLIDGVLGARAADSLWLLDRDGNVLAQGALVGQAGGAFADPDPAAAALARAAAASGRPAALVERGGTVDGVFAAAPTIDRTGTRQGAVLLRLPLEGRRQAERDAAVVAAAAVALLAAAGFVLGRAAG